MTLDVSWQRRRRLILGLKAAVLRALPQFVAFIALCCSGCTSSLDPHAAHESPPKYVIDQQVADAIRDSDLPDFARRVFDKLLNKKLHELARADLKTLAENASWQHHPNKTSTNYSFLLNDAVPHDPIEGDGAHAFSMTIVVCHQCNKVIGGHVGYLSFGGS